jgi:multidrug resistance efflux pump
MPSIEEVHARLIATIALIARATAKMETAQAAVGEARAELQRARANVEGLQGEPGFSTLVTEINNNLHGAEERCSAIVVACNAASFFAEAARLKSLRKAQTLRF